MAADYFLKLESVPGESQDAKCKDEIQLESWSFGERQTGTMAFGGGGGGGKVAMNDFNFVMKTNKASPTLFIRCATGKHLPTATLTCRKAGGTQEPYFIVKFTDLLVSSFNISGSGFGDDNIPRESISFNYTKVEVEYKVQGKDGKMAAGGKAGWDLKANVKV